MSNEAFSAGYESEFTAPVHTILSVEHDGLVRTTTVVINGEIVKFETNELNWRAGAAIADIQKGQNE